MGLYKYAVTDSTDIVQKICAEKLVHFVKKNKNKKALLLLGALISAQRLSLDPWWCFHGSHVECLLCTLSKQTAGKWNAGQLFSALSWLMCQYYMECIIVYIDKSYSMFVVNLCICCICSNIYVRMHCSWNITIMLLRQELLVINDNIMRIYLS